MKFSYSRLECFANCPYQYKLRYVDKLKTLPDQSPSNALYLGTAIHEAFETGNVEDAIKSYRSNYYVLSDEHINEEIKLEYLIPKALELLPDAECEIEISTEDFIGYIDRLVYLYTDENNIKHYSIMDYKYSNNIDRYLESKQLHIYKYYFELTHPNTVVDSLYYVFVPKFSIRQKKSETLHEFRQRLKEHLDSSEIKVIEIDYDVNSISQFQRCCQQLKQVKSFPKNPTRLCGWCSYQSYCESNGEINWSILNDGEEESLDLPANKKRSLKKEKITKLPDTFIYGASYVGKSSVIDTLDNVLFVNTDGNYDMYQNPYVFIGKTVTMNGRMKIEKSAWENFLELVDELEKKQNTFEYICLDLVEDLREYCRIYICNKLKIPHESDSNFSKAWDMVTTEFNQAMKRLKAAGYTIIRISKEVAKEVNEKSGAKYTTFRPNIQEKAADSLAGMSKLSIRAYVDDKGERWFNLEPNPHWFGGGRYNFKVDRCKLDVNELLKAINEADEKY